jgi:hypothetical protein
MIDFGITMARAIAKPLGRMLGEKLADAALGPKFERSLGRVAKRTLEEIVDALLPDADRDSRVHVQDVLQYDLVELAHAGVFDIHSPAERRGVARRCIEELDAPESWVDTSTLGIDVLQVVGLFLEELPERIREAASEDPNLFPYAVIEQLRAVSDVVVDAQRTLDAIAGSGALDPALTDLEAARIAILRSGRLQESLEALYPDHALLEMHGALWPIAVRPASDDEWDDLRSPLGSLEGHELPARDAPYPDSCNPAGETEYEWRLRSQSETSFNGPTYDFRRLYEDDKGSTKIDFGLGRFFVSQATSEILEDEFYRALDGRQGGSVGLEAMPMRAWLHGRVDNPVLDGTGRSAAVSVATCY